MKKNNLNAVPKTNMIAFPTAVQTKSERFENDCVPPFSSSFERVDLNEMLTDGNPNHVLLRVKGNSTDGDVRDGDCVILDRDEKPRKNDLTVVRENEGFYIRRHQSPYDGRRGLFLVSANDERLEPVSVPNNGVEILGIVRYIITNPNK